MAANNFLTGDQFNQQTPGQQRQANGTLPQGEVPPPNVNPGVVYTDQSGKGYSAAELNNAWNSGSMKNDPANARVGDILQQYGYGGSSGPTAPAAPAGNGAPAGSPYNGSPQATPDPRSNQLIDLLMGRAQQSLNLDPNDPIIKNQVDAYSANNQRAQRSYLSQAAERGGPNANLDAVSRSMAEKGAQSTGDLQSTLMGNELTARRGEIQNALSEAGSMLTSQQQLALQRELGLIDSQLRQQQVNSGNDQFMAQLGLNSENQNNYWDALRSGLL